VKSYTFHIINNMYIIVFTPVYIWKCPFIDGYMTLASVTIFRFRTLFRNKRPLSTHVAKNEVNICDWKFEFEHDRHFWSDWHIVDGLTRSYVRRNKITAKRIRWLYLVFAPRWRFCGRSIINCIILSMNMKISFCMADR